MKPIHRIEAARGLSVAFVLAAAAIAPSPALGQDAPGRAIFKCQSGSAPVYTDQPCAGAQSTLAVISAPASPARDASATSEPARTDQAAEARAIEIQEHRTFNAAAFARSPKAECPHLIQRIAYTESEERGATGGALRIVHERLSVQRKRYKELGCSGFGSALAEQRARPATEPAVPIAAQRSLARDRLSIPGA